MLPIFRILPVGGVLLAIFILVLALSPPDGSRAPLNTAMGPARGALVDRNRHPETRQFLILAAVKRANELNRLRELPDTPTRTEAAPVETAPTESDRTETPAEPQVATLPADRSEADPDQPAATPETRGTDVPADISKPAPGAPPVASEKSAPVDTSRARSEIRRKAHRVRRPRPTTAAKQQELSLFEILFGSQHYQYQAPAYSGQQANQQPAFGTQTTQPQQQQQPQRQQPQRPQSSQPQPYSYGAPQSPRPQQYTYGTQQSSGVQSGYNPQPVTQVQPPGPSQQPIGPQPTFGEQPGPQAIQPNRPVQRPTTRRSRANTGRQSAQSGGGIAAPNPSPAY
jgi:hypothetical protein